MFCRHRHAIEDEIRVLPSWRFIAARPCRKCRLLGWLAGCLQLGHLIRSNTHDVGNRWMLATLARLIPIPTRTHRPPVLNTTPKV